jgi:hypothetical protein
MVYAILLADDKLTGIGRRRSVLFVCRARCGECDWLVSGIRNADIGPVEVPQRRAAQVDRVGDVGHWSVVEIDERKN